MPELKDLIERLENDALVDLLKERNRDISYLSDQALVTAVELKTGWPRATVSAATTYAEGRQDAIRDILALLKSLEQQP
ncbi:hypothetical protein [Phenylobacterium sp.]|uniref:hypothetical protein n=1 Tax=Phenylobacterium sp. TaxID=1871053 RepID=UPI0019839B06|nr:hypothetical protein [Phenylobacterium sp.]MBC7168766.1 hypothetical protein [Phenylobacterium sp.]